VPKPLPDYLPGEIREEITLLGYSGILDYTEKKLGLKRTRLVSVFSGKHTRLRQYKALADFLGLSLDALALLEAGGTLPKVVLKKCQALQIPLVAAERATGCSWLTHKVSGQYSGSGLKTYTEVAAALGWSLEKLAKVCLTKDS